jgi:hypothetical protein
MKNSLKKEARKNAKMVTRLNGYMSKINKVLSEMSPVSTSVRRKSSLSQTEQVLKVIKSAGKKGVTSDEVLNALPNIPYGSVTSKYSSLKKSGHIKVDGRTRDGDSGKQQHIMWSEKNYAIV